MADKRAAVALGRLLLRDKGRIYDTVQMWLFTKRDALRRFDDFDGLAAHVFDTILGAPVALEISLNSINFFGSPLFAIPLRFLQRGELQHLHLLLKQQLAQGGVFSSSVDLQGFKLCYTNFRLNPLLGQQVDRVAFVQAFIEVCLSQTWGEERRRLRALAGGYFGKAAKTFSPACHPCQAQLWALAKEYNKN